MHAVLYALLCLAPLLQDGLENPGFELVGTDAGIEGWRQTPSSRDAGYRVELAGGGAAEGESFARLFFAGDGAPGANGNLLQKIDAAPLRGQRLRVRAALRVEPGTHGGGMWLRVDRANGEVGIFHSPREQLVRAEAWTEVVIEDVVDADATSLSIGFALFGPGAVHLDDVRLELAGPPPPYQPEAARAPDGRGLDNLVAFARLLGYVRFFHPSDEAADADWDAVALAGVRAVEGARDAGELARVLALLFEPLAPGVQVFVTGNPPDAATEGAELEGRLYLRWWEHEGYGDSSGQYRSRRRRARVRDGEHPKGAPDPREPFQAELGAGVSCRVPLSVFARSAGSLPVPSAAARPLPAPHPLADGEDRATRLAAAMLAWNLAQHFYPHFDVGGADWPAQLRVVLSRAAEDAGQGEFLITLERLVAALADGHGRAGCDALRPAWKLPFEWDWIEEQVVITLVAPGVNGGPAPGDVVLELDGQPMGELLRDQEPRSSGATPWFRRRAALDALRRGVAGSERQLTVQRFSGGEEESLALAPVRSGTYLPRERPEVVDELEPGIFYVDLDRIDHAIFNAALPRLVEAEGIVFDLRGYPDRIHPLAVLPHLVGESVEGDRLEVPFFTAPDQVNAGTKSAPPWEVEPRSPRITATLAFLSGSSSISAAESWLSLVQSNDLAEIVGSASAGANGSATEHILPGGYSVQWTGMRVLRRDGSRVQGVGIQPTVPVAPSRAGVAAGRDEVLERALALVRD